MPNQNRANADPLRVVSTGDAWRKVAEFEVGNAAEAFGHAAARLPREHYDKPMALRPVHDGPPALIEPLAGGLGRD